MDKNDILYTLYDAITPIYYHSLQVIMANRDWMPRFPDENGHVRIAIVQLINMTNNVEALEAIQLGAKKWAEMTQPFRAAPPEVLAQAVKQLVERYVAVIAKNPLQFSASMLSKELTESITGDLLSQCLMKYQLQDKFFDDDNVLRQLSHQKLGLIEPWFQAAVCGPCHNFELLLSSWPRKESKCSKCGRDMAIARTYRLNHQFELHKLENKDLPLFIASYLKRKVPVAIVEVSKKIPKGTDSSDITTDIDVCIPTTKTGIECKLFVNPRPNGSQFDSYAGELASNLIKYAESGMERLIAVTNLPEDEAKKMSETVKEKLAQKGVKPAFFCLVHFSFEELLRMLDIEIAEINAKKT